MAEEGTKAAAASPAPMPRPPVGRPDSEHDLFGRLVDGVAADADADWGFLVVRTAYAADAAADAQKWSRALARLRRLATAAGGHAAAAALATPVMACPATLEGARYSDVRRAFAAWRTRYLQAAAGRNETPGGDDGDDDGGDGWPAAVRPDCCLVVDASALESLLADEDDADGAWVVVVDARDPRTVGYGGGGGPFAGWLRAAAPALGRLADDLTAGLGLAEDLCPPRAHLGQVPLYGGGWPAVRLVALAPAADPDRYYRFPGGPGGTVRGAAPAAALLARILRDVGESVYE